MHPVRLMNSNPWSFAWGVAVILGLAGFETPGADLGLRAGGLLYTNIVVADVPWSIHMVKAARNGQVYQIQARHAGSGVLGLSTLSEQIAAVEPERGTPVAGINGGFYQRDKAYAGCPRGLQIVEGEVLSAPSGNVSLWIDVLGDLHLTNVTPRFEITWPGGAVTPFDLNGPRVRDGVSLYTPAVGDSTHTTNGMELVLEREAGGRWLPLQAGRSYPARVREVRRAGDTVLSPGTMVVSLAPGIAERFQGISPGAVLRISTESSPRLLGARTALSGGPWLVRNGKRQKIRAAPDDPYESSSMLERHPRTAIGWNADSYFLVVVDGRQRDVSEGMTLEELSKYLVKLGCEEAFNLDGGGSSTLWFEGEVRNSPCDGYERTIANSLVVVRKAAQRPTAAQTSTKSTVAPERRQDGGH